MRLALYIAVGAALVLGAAFYFIKPSKMDIQSAMIERAQGKYMTQIINGAYVVKRVQ